MLNKAQRACELCRRRKRRCDRGPEDESCTQCKEKGSLCQTSTATTLRKPHRRRRLLELEAKLRQLEQSISTSSLSHRSETAHYHLVRSHDVQPEYQVHSGHTDSLLQKPIASSELYNNPIFNPDSLVGNSKTYFGHCDLPQSIPAFSIPDGGLIAMPGSEKPVVNVEAWLLLQEYISDFQEDIPIFPRTTLIQAFRKADGGINIDWASHMMLDVVMAIAYSLRGMSPAANPEDAIKAEQHAARALAALPKTFTDSSLLSAQCLLGLAVHVEYSRNGRDSLPLLAASIRMMQKIRADMQDTSFDRTSASVDNLLAVAFFMEANICLVHSIQPSMVADELHIATLAPQLDASRDEVETAEILQRHVQLARIQARLSSKLVKLRSGTRATRVLEQERTDFEIWYDATVTKFGARDTNNISLLMHRSDIVHFIIIESKVFRTVWFLNGLEHIENFVRSRYTKLNELRDEIIDCGQRLYRDATKLLQVFVLGPETGAYLVLTADAVASAVCVIMSHIDIQRPHSGEEEIQRQTGAALDRLFKFADFRSDSRISAIGKLCSLFHDVVDG